MCGLFGWLRFEGELSEKEEHSARHALSLLAHRGPDHQGEWRQPGLYMGHRRLSIIDLSSEAHQPFFDDDKKLVTVFNGEIYNYVEIRKELETLGVSFHTSSDTEVLLKAYRVWGTEAFKKFDGMFVAALYDLRAGSLCLVRDHMGQKPLYYHCTGSEIIFSSELKPILSLDNFSWKIDRENFLRYLHASYHPWDATPLCGVKKLPPAHYLFIQEGKTRLERYWDSVPGTTTHSIGYEEATEELKRLIERSASISIRSDVPFGAFISGGVDSSLVLDYCSKQTPAISAHCVSMSEKDFDESAKAHAVCSFLGVDDERKYEMNEECIDEAIEAFFRFNDEPHGDPGFINAWFLAKSCRPYITVGLAGDGADELFAGYISFKAVKKARLIRALPQGAISLLRKGVENLLRGGDAYMGLQFKALSFLQGFPSTADSLYPLWLGTTSPEELSRLCPWMDQGFFNRSGGNGTLLDPYTRLLGEKTEGRTGQQKLAYFYQKFFLPEFVCLHTDRAAMQHSMEVRSPFLSPSIVEFANSLPDDFLFKGETTKRILRDLVQQRGYPESIWRQKKQGFTFPIARWLKSTLKERLETLRKDEIIQELVNAEVVDQLISEHLSGKKNHYRLLFNLMVFRNWMLKNRNVRI